MTHLIVWQMVLVFFSILHIFEEFGMGVEKTIKKHTKAKNPRGFYLRACSVIMAVSFAALILTYLQHPLGYYLTLFPIFLAAANFIVHNIAYIKEKKLYGTLAVGVFTTYPAVVSAGFTLYYLLPMI